MELEAKAFPSAAMIRAKRFAFATVARGAPLYEFCATFALPAAVLGPVE
jgi:hypothetical protein